jgi:hypothetical protein
MITMPPAICHTYRIDFNAVTLLHPDISAIASKRENSAPLIPVYIYGWPVCSRQFIKLFPYPSTRLRRCRKKTRRGKSNDLNKTKVYPFVYPYSHIQSCIAETSLPMH